MFALMVKGSHRAEMNSQEIIDLRGTGWKGLPPPPVFMTGKAKSSGANQKDPAEMPAMASLGIPSRDIEPKIPQPPPPEHIVVPEKNVIPGSPTTLRSPSMSIATLSDFTVANTSDDEPLDSMAITPHDTFYLEDGNVEVLCGNILFLVHASILSFHSPVLGQMFTKANLATAESPTGYPRILSADTALDFATLLKIIYLPVYATLDLFQ